MEWLKHLVLSHKAALGLALLASVIASFPQAYFRFEHRDDGVYQGIEMLPDSPWTARVREVMDGHPNFGAIYYKDGKDNPYVFQPLGSIVVGYSGKALGLDINNTILLSRAVLPFVAFLVLYAFVLALSRKKLVALCAASVWLLGESALSVFGTLQLLYGVSPEDFLRLSRPVSPVMVYIFTFGFLGAFYKFYRSNDWRWGVLATLLLGANFYNYFYSWTFLYAVGGILGLLLLLRKQWTDAARVAAVFTGALVIGLFCFLNLYQATQHPNYAETSLRTGFIETNAPLFIGFTALGALLAFLIARYGFGLWKEDGKNYLFGLALLLAPLVTLNQQVLTGKVLQEAHYHWFLHKPAAAIMVILIAFYLLERYKPSYQKVLAGLLIAGSFAIGAFVQFDSYTHEYKEGGTIAIERQKYGPPVRWLTENAEKEAVVLSSDLASHIVTIYTPLNAFYHRAGLYSLGASNARLEEVIFSFYRLRGITAAETETVFFDERGFLSANVYGIHYRELCGSYECIPDEKITELAARYTKTLAVPAERWFEETMQKYEVEYVLWDKKTDPLWQLERYPFLTKAAEFGDIAIYRTVYGN